MLVVEGRHLDVEEGTMFEGEAYAEEVAAAEEAEE